MPGFTHLHVHSEYSLLDGLARVPDLVQTAKARGFESLALTDHGVMYGAVQFYKAALKAGIKPILGCELYVAPRSRFDRDSVLDRKAYHLTVLAENERGYRNLLALVSAAQLEGFYYKPRVDRELLERHSEGLIVLSGCPGADAPSKIVAEQLDAAREAMGWYAEVFRGRFYVEMQVHDIDFIPRLNRELLGMARALDLPLVATNDVHYCNPEDPRAHEVLLCIQTGTTMDDPKRMRIGDTFYLRSEAEMRALFPELPEAIDNTAEIAERCRVEMVFNQYKLPRFDVPSGETAASFLLRLCEKGLAERYGDYGPETRARLDYELSVIGQMGFDDYFLIVWDLCRFAREQGVWWNVRGSGAGSIVAYSLRITNIDPLHHNLIFERFLNPSRVSMPDIDLDFPDDQRDLLIRYTFQKYGHDRVAQIITFGTMGARAAIRDAGRALGMELTEVDRIAKMVPAIPGKACGIGDAMRASTPEAPNEFYTHELVDEYGANPAAQNLLDTAQTLEGVARHASTHAAGVVISDRPLVEYIPLNRPTRGGDDGGEVLPVTQFNMNDVEQLGLLKVDFLGLATLTVLRRAAELVERYHGKRYTLDTIPLDDPAIYQLLSSGHVTGVFQVEGAGMRRMLREMRPKQFENVVAAIALYRPGPMEYIPTYIRRLHGEEQVRYRHAALEPILSETYGIIVYQEQIIRIARDLAGYDAGEADTIRKAVSKKIKAKLVEHHEKFVSGAVAKGIPQAAAQGTWEDIETFARYGFNKAHAADYGVIVCQTAYLKAHYPVEYMAALLSVERGNTDKVAFVTADCRRLGIALLPPDLNASELDFSIETLDEAARERFGAKRQRGIRFGLAAIKNVGDGPVRAILEARAEGGAFADLDDLGRRVDLRQVGKRALECLAKAGAFDAFGDRYPILAVLDRMLQSSGAHHQAVAIGQMSLFGDAMPVAETSLLYPLPAAEGDPREALDWEKELIGLYVSDHPMQRAAEQIAESATVLIGEIDAAMSGQPVTIGGMVTSIRQITTRKGQPMAFARLEDLQGSIEVTIFPRTFASTKDLWREDTILLVIGKVEARDDRVQVICDLARPLESGPGTDAGEPPSWGRAASGAPALDATPEATDASEMAVAPAPPPLERQVAMAGQGAEPRRERVDQPAPAARAARPRPAPDLAQAPNPVAPPAPDPAPVGMPESPEAPEHAPYRLSVKVPRSEDHEHDIHLIGRVFQALTSFEGRDRFSLCMPNGAGQVELDFPNDTTRYCVGLVKAVEALVGAGQVTVQAPTLPERPTWVKRERS